MRKIWMTVKKIFKLISPLLLFDLLLWPYAHLNKTIIIDTFGSGWSYYPNANDVSNIFWYAVAICVALISIYRAITQIKGKWWLKSIYVLAMLVISLYIAKQIIPIFYWR